jgi:hypothetical protein
VCALTNNWNPLFADMSFLKDSFDHVVESWRVGMRKPETRIYQVGRHICALTSRSFISSQYTTELMKTTPSQFGLIYTHSFFMMI